MAPNNQQQQAAAAAAAAAAAVRLPDFHADSPQCWFTNLDSQFATANITQSITKFHWAVSKLPALLLDTIGALCNDPATIVNPYGELQIILLRSYSLSVIKKTAHMEDHSGLGFNKPSILLDQLMALMHDLLDDVAEA